MDTVMLMIQSIIDYPATIVYLVFILGMFPLGSTGLSLRRAVETKKQLKKIRQQMKMQGYQVNDQWRRKNKEASRRIWRITLGWIAAYIIIWLLFSPLEFFFSLLGLIIPIFGYYGRRFWLTSDVG